jgi:hypothetical protein
MAQLRATIASTEAELERTRFAARRTAGMGAVRDRLIALAKNFATTAAHATGPVLRELVRPWLASATHNKQTRVLTLRIRRVPEITTTEENVMNVHSSRAQG